ncbi:MAG: hypothetical protein LBD09_01955 [Treponema sp.]|jgi:hypothetical protein|nr:hypothetical protein [Treponema sp.]
MGKTLNVPADRQNVPPGGRNVPGRRDLALCLVWIAVMLLLGGGLWFGTAPYRSRLLAERVNRALASGTDRRRVEVPAAGFRPAPGGGPGLMGTWYPVVNAAAAGNTGNSGGGNAGNSGGNAGNSGAARVFVFTMIRPGAAACAAFVDESGKVKTIVPLSGSATQIAGGLPLPLYDFYVSRIEAAARTAEGPGE